MDPQFEYVFPSIRGIQAGREYYVSMCPLKLIPKVFSFDEDELAPEIRAQRSLNRSRVPEMSQYVLDNPRDYVFSALTASIDGDVKFVAVGKDATKGRMGELHVAMESRFIINDGQHRRAAIEMVIKENPDIANESISIVFFMDVGLKRCQQMFADLNRYAIRPSKSIGVLYDHRDEMAELTRQVVYRTNSFINAVEMEKSTLAKRSRKLFTLSAIHSATKALTAGMKDEALEKRIQVATDYWEEVDKQFKEWQLVRDNKLTAGELRTDYIHTHGVVLQALGRVGSALLRDQPKTWKRKLVKLKKIDWSRANQKVWEGRAMIGGRVSKSENNVTLTTNYIKKQLDMTLSPEESRVEKSILRAHAHGSR